MCPHGYSHMYAQMCPRVHMHMCVLMYVRDRNGAVIRLWGPRPEDPARVGGASEGAGGRTAGVGSRPAGGRGQKQALRWQAQGDRGTARLMPRRRHVLPQPGWGLPRGLLVLRTLVCTAGRGRRGLRSFSEPGQACLRSRLTFPPAPGPSHFRLRPQAPVPTSGWCFQRVGGGGPGSPSAGPVGVSGAVRTESGGRSPASAGGAGKPELEVTRPKPPQGEAGRAGEDLSGLC